MSVVTDYPDWSPHVANAQQIAATGVPLLTLSSLVQSASGLTIAGAGVHPFPAVTIGQIGYEVRIDASIPFSATIPFLEVQMIWTDPAANKIMATDTFIVPSSSGGQAFTVIGRGPSKAAVLQVQVTNLDPAQTATINISVLQNSRVYPRDDWRWQGNVAPSTNVPGFTLPTMPPDESVLGVLDGVTIAASSQNTYLFGMHDGLLNVGYEVNTGAASNLSIRIRPKPDGQYSAHNIIYSAVSPPSNFQIAASRAPLGVVVANSATTAMVLSLGMIRAD